MEKIFFGRLNSGDEVHKYTLKNDLAEVSFLDYGAAIQSFTVYGTDIVGGFDTTDGYENDTSHQGAIIGRIANRVENARFTMDGKVYVLPKNDGENCLHGGCGFDFKIWSVTHFSDEKIVFEYLSRDGEEGFPSNLKVKVSYTLCGSALTIAYSATPDGRTPISLTNHSYFNLDGLGKDILKHKAVIYADTYTEVNENLIPNGEHPAVENTPFDFKTPHEIGERIGGDFIGYDHNFVINPKTHKTFCDKELGLIAEVYGKTLKMEVYTDQPGVQFYIGNFLGNGPDFKGGVKQVRHGAFCLETQTEPNSVNLGVGIYGNGEEYVHTTVYSISTAETDV